MTGGDLTFRVTRSLGFDDSSATDEYKLVQTWANDAVVDVLLKTRCTIAWVSTAITAGVTEYTLEANWLAVDSIKGPTALGTGPWRRASIQEVLELQETGTVSVDPPVAAIDGSYLTIAPSLYTGNLQVLGVVRPTQLFATANLGTPTNNSNDPSNSIYGGIPQEYHRALEYYMLWRGSEYDDKSAATYGKGSAQGYLDRYNEELKMIRRASRRRGGVLATAKAPGYPGRPGRGLGRNDVYPNR